MKLKTGIVKYGHFIPAPLNQRNEERSFMRKTNIFRFIDHIIKMGSASGNKRILYALGNILIMALGVLFAFCIKWLFTGVGDGTINFFAGLLGIILCIPLTVLCFLQGFVAQVALVFIAGIGIFHRGERFGNFLSFLIALATTVGVIIVLIVYLGGV